MGIHFPVGKENEKIVENKLELIRGNKSKRII